MLVYGSYFGIFWLLVFFYHFSIKMSVRAIRRHTGGIISCSLLLFLEVLGYLFIHFLCILLGTVFTFYVLTFYSSC